MSGVTHAHASLAARLRERTREVHERVEHTASFNRLIVVRLPDPATLVDPGERARRERAGAEYREVYRRFLVAAHGFEEGVERALAASPALAAARATGLETETPSGAALIRDDLALGFGLDAAALPRMEAPPAPATLGALAGMEYVRRGSRAGGAVIGAAVHHNLGLTRERGAAFLLRYGRETRAVIGRFKDWLDGLGLDEREADAAETAAIATFEAVERWHRALERRFETATLTPAR
jgi:heme oxygenase